ncbi:MAG: glycosyltransferase family 2 protein [Pelotomaculum sp.]|uniref:Glycosyltransferase 2-like domain-containing protein n=1 Tax=Pelotomaculum thermopropionicum (strain DSM 13744 / JCM 10971 / SI) TaxID=370438 RepID=A5D675_PELTS|nr:glycosyltransferase family 2 protein [Pelotomaculum sp.]BAF58263.1 hypothetical protein PTH_0082 [Pelotomaculum thermopropionicum SI]
MLAAVVPARNEEKSIKKIIDTLLGLPFDLIIPVINGCTDNSYGIVMQIKSPRVAPLYFKEPLGIDVPRAMGAKAALDKGATAVLFLDGDMDGDIAASLAELIAKVNNGADMALTNCYPGEYQVRTSLLASFVLKVRSKLNREINLEHVIGAASPSHGPHAVSRRLLLSIPLKEVAMPPVTLALAAKKGLSVCVGTAVPHRALGSPDKDPAHSERIAETIIGDCLEAIRVYKNKKRHRSLGAVEYNGYNSCRRWDLLDDFLGQAGPDKVVAAPEQA